MSIMDLLSGTKNKTPKQGQNAELGKVLAVGIPIILMAMRTKSQDDSQAKDLGRALEDHEQRNTADAWDRLDQSDEEDGRKILGHVLGSEEDQVIQDIAQRAGVNAGDVRKILSQASPAVMEELAEQTKGDRSPERIREVTNKELKDYQNDTSMPDLQDIISGALGNLGGSGGKSVVSSILKQIL